ncbi:MAG: hypothetical protein AAFV53_28590, partial [Myxococcota bacterium]
MSVWTIAWMSAAITTAQAQQQNAWADKIILDTRSSSVMFVWFDGTRATRVETVPFSSVRSLERLPTYEGMDEELALLTNEGDVLLAAMGPRTREDAVVFSAVLDTPIRVLDPETPRMVPRDIAAQYRGPRLVLGSVSGPSAMQPISDAYVQSNDFLGLDLGEDDFNEELVYEEPSGWRSPLDGRGELDKTAIDIVV